MFLFAVNNTMIICSIINFFVKISDITIIQISNNRIYFQSIEQNNNIMFTTQIKYNKTMNFMLNDEIIDIPIKTKQLQIICFDCYKYQKIEFYYFKNINKIQIKIIEKIKIKYFDIKLIKKKIPFLLMDHLQWQSGFQFTAKDIMFLCTNFFVLDNYVTIKIINKDIWFKIDNTNFNGKILFENKLLIQSNNSIYFNKKFETKYLKLLRHILQITQNVIIWINEKIPVKIQLIHEFGLTDIYILSIDLYN